MYCFSTPTSLMSPHDFHPHPKPITYKGSMTTGEVYTLTSLTLQESVYRFSTHIISARSFHHRTSRRLIGAPHTTMPWMAN
ncbi:hypothetical protein Hypma_014587 [Hypsizygus marmoreus]|uniref:Uncharacterized protein n=1 Tax=Hypsizygus marmoreus TaxID=39966 RepID=A0A369JAG1_HYPMA|nr:hypothetical protein Hypma_014587 [Hypsizygus marmoreus]